jgi:peptidoglycan/LPS O-acetylase OafA/YrhL
VLLLGFVILPALMKWLGEPYEEIGNPWYFIFFVGNFHLINVGFPHSPIISVLWSVSVEEQFYIFWPFLMMLFRGVEKWLMALMILIFGFTTVYYFDTDVKLWFHTLFLLSDICIGAMFAFVSFKRGSWFGRLERLGRSVIFGVYTLFFCCLFFYRDIFQNEAWASAGFLIFEKLLFASILGFIIFEQNFSSNSIVKFGRLKAITYLGTISYGLFCLHEIGLLVGNRVLRWTGLEHDVTSFLVLKPLLAFAIILPIAHFSWHYFEKPFLRLKRYFYTPKAGLSNVSKV